MKRSPLWIAAFVQAWDRIESIPIIDPSPPHAYRRPTDAEVGQRCALEADRCEAAYVAAFGPIDDI